MRSHFPSQSTWLSMHMWHESFSHTQNNNYQRQIDNLNSTNDEDDVLIKLLRPKSSTPAAAPALAPAAAAAAVA